MNWRVACPGGGSYVVGEQFREPLSTFSRRGLRFSVTATESPAGGPSAGRVRATVSGRLSANLRTAQGTAIRTVLWYGAHAPAHVCRSGPVRWRAELAPGLKPN